MKLKERLKKIFCRHDYIKEELLNSYICGQYKIHVYRCKCLKCGKVKNLKSII